MSAWLKLVGAPLEDLDEGLLPAAVRYLGSSGDALTELETASLRRHLAHLGARPSVSDDPEAILARLEESELSGRGGGHFPVARKWRAALAASAHGQRPLVVANGAEGEPLSRKDAALLELRPHLVLDGLACAAEAVGAAEAVVWMHEGAHAARVAVSRALAERRDRGLAEPAMRVELGPDHYLAGESSAVAQGVAGGPALPTFRRSPAATCGVLVHNVDTLARIALLARDEPAADTVLVSVSDTRSIVVLDLPAYVTIADAVVAAVGDVPMQAVLVGGYGGSWVTWSDAEALPLAEPELRAVGLSLGAGVLHALPRSECGLERVATIAEYLAAATARQCGPCLFGLPAIAGSMRALAQGGWLRRREAGRVEEFVAAVRGRGACHHPDGAAQLVSSALRVFEADVGAHLRGRCRHREGRPA